MKYTSAPLVEPPPEAALDPPELEPDDLLLLLHALSTRPSAAAATIAPVTLPLEVRLYRILTPLTGMKLDVPAGRLP